MNQNKRILFIDYLRGLAVIVMIEVHVVNAFLKKEIRGEWWFEIVNYINGLVAPSFLFITGFAFALTLERKWDDYLKINKVFWKQIQRIFQIWIIGYALHIPYFSFHKMYNEMNQKALINFMKVDVLHCIAFSLILLMFLVLTIRNKKCLFYSAILISLLLIFSSPIIWNISFKNNFTPFVMYLNNEQGSLFPIFPWMGFVFVGIVTAFIYQKYKSDENIYSKIIKYSIFVIIISVVIELIPFSFYTNYNYFRTSPNFFFQRLGIVTLLLGLFGLIESKNKLSNSFVNVVGSESLIVYSVHLLVIFGMFFDNKSLSFIIGNTQEFSTTILWSFSLIFSMIILAYIWNYIKRKNINYARIIQYTILMITLYLFFTRRY